MKSANLISESLDDTLQLNGQQMISVDDDENYTQTFNAAQVINLNVLHLKLTQQ